MRGRFSTRRRATPNGSDRMGNRAVIVVAVRRDNLRVRHGATRSGRFHVKEGCGRSGNLHIRRSGRVLARR
jgi:hypothetical protein